MRALSLWFVTTLCTLKLNASNCTIVLVCYSYTIIFNCCWNKLQLTTKQTLRLASSESSYLQTCIDCKNENEPVWLAIIWRRGRQLGSSHRNRWQWIRIHHNLIKLEYLHPNSMHGKQVINWEWQMMADEIDQYVYLPTHHNDWFLRHHKLLQSSTEDEEIFCCWHVRGYWLYVHNFMHTLQIMGWNKCRLPKQLLTHGLRYLTVPLMHSRRESVTFPAVPAITDEALHVTFPQLLLIVSPTCGQKISSS